MSEHGGDAGPAEQMPRSPLYDYVDLGLDDQRDTTVPEAAEGAGLPERSATLAGGAEETEHRRREFAALLGEFRRTPVLVPVDEDDAPLTADFGGVRWIYAFSDEAALARFALARGEGGREWAYRRWLGARLLDAMVPAVGVPCGVALDCADGADGVVFPPVRGVVPDEVAVDVDGGTEDET
ncbi:MULTISPECIES: hypothetical protein [Streptomyces]|uniref:SseB protein N-terminal domain-containing protein n=1 Tax=Streptomyces tricolor TaxID=68277 RepID=A0ABS9JSW7_9ACTN|nr:MULTISPECIES: hypothetical protein [Streptomyces]MCG0068642.1 hypothetical protein [Streptomyces tricolor]BCM69574.1 hypothetical protein EASAB2608_04908 [Streptomyces sp. EAS-AB2608]